MSYYKSRSEYLELSWFENARLDYLIYGVVKPNLNQKSFHNDSLCLCTQQ